MLVPSRLDPRWKALVLGTTDYQLKGLATRMVVTRVRLMACRKDANGVEDAIRTAYEYFSRNLESAQGDLHAVFGMADHSGKTTS